MRHTLLVFLAGLIVAAPAAAASPDLDAPQVSVRWRLGFGGAGGVHAGYALALGYRAVATPDAVELIELDVSDQAALARLAGLPLLERRYRADQSELDPAPADPAPRPWYARQWLFWTAGGLAAAAALASGSGSSGEADPGFCGENNDDCTFSGNGNAACIGDTCVICDNGDVASGCGGGGLVETGFHGLQQRELALPALDAGTGGMGDLVAR